MMALDGLLLNNIVHELSDLTPLRINRIAQISEYELVFECYRHEKINLLFSIDSTTNRLSITNEPFVRHSEPSHFVMLLRKHCGNGWIQSIKQIDLDRVIELKITNSNDLGDTVNLRIMVELMGKYANVILVDESNKILDAFNRIPPYENTKRIIFSGASYHYPEQEDKKNPFDQQDSINLDDSLVKQYFGFSPLLAREVEYRIRNHEDFNDILQTIQKSKTLYVHSNYQFHAIELKHIHLPYETFPLIEGLEYAYQAKVQAQRVKQHTGNLQKLITRELKKSKKKEQKLKVQYLQASDHDHFRDYGDLLMTYGYQIARGTKEVTLTDFNNQEVTIDLDERYDGIDNAQLYFQKYRKLKKGLSHIQHQLELAQDDIEYFEGLDHQIKHVDVKNALEIRQELIDKGVIRQKQKPQQRKKKDEPSTFKTIIFDDVQFHYGLTNKQNEQLTFRHAHKSDSWFHILDGAGSHVVAEVAFKDLNERLIRFGANLAAYHSRFSDSSSVAVAYTAVSELKKIPKAPLGKVAMNEYTTIFIDPIDPLLMSDSLDQIGTTRDKMMQSDS